MLYFLENVCYHVSMMWITIPAVILIAAIPLAVVIYLERNK